MDGLRIASIACSVILAHVLLHYLGRYKRWKDSRTEILAYRNWRGVYVPDLKLKRVERAVIWFVILTFVIGAVLSYLFVTNYVHPNPTITITVPRE